MKTSTPNARALGWLFLAMLLPAAPTAKSETMVQVDDRDLEALVRVDFTPATNSSAYQGTLLQKGGAVAPNLGGSFTFEFTGHKIELFGIRGANWGDCQIFVDDMATPATVLNASGVATTVVSTYNSQTINQALLCTWADPSGLDLRHTIKLLRLGTNNSHPTTPLPAANTRSISFDFARIYTVGGGAGVPITGLALEPATATVAVGATSVLSPVFTPAETTERDLTWTTSDPTVATVVNGTVTAVAVGTTEIRATSVADTELVGVCQITVTPVLVTGVTVQNPLRGLLYPGQTAKMLGVVTPANAGDKALTWTSSDETVATVDAIGLVTAIAPGAVTITATSVAAPDKAGTASFEVSAIPMIAASTPVAPAAAAPRMWLTEQANPADGFVESLSTQVYYWRRTASDFNHDIYFDRFEEAKDYLRELRLRYVRGRPQTDAEWMVTSVYEDTGARFLLVNGVDGSGSEQTLNAYQNILRRLGPAVKYIEGPNEQDGNSFTYAGLSDTQNDFPALSAYQHDLYNRVRAMPEAAQHGWLVAGPSPGDPKVAQRFAELMWDACDFPTLHSYTSGRMPAHNIDSANFGPVQLGLPVGVKLRVASTEGGVTNAVRSTAQQPAVSEIASAKYIPRQHFEYFNRGMAIIPTFELYDRAVGDNRLIHQNGNWGLIRNTGSPKPAFNTLRDIVRLVEDPGAAFVPKPLRFGLSGATTRVHHTLLQKRDGRYILALWQDAESFDNSNRTNGTDLLPPSVSIGVHLARSATSVRVFTPFFSDRAGKGQLPVAEYVDVSAFSLSVPDHVVLVEITLPGAAPTEFLAEPFRTPLSDRFYFQAETVPSAASEESSVAKVTGSVRALGAAYAELRTGSTGSFIEFEVQVPEPGLYEVRAGNVGQPNNGIHQLSVDGEPLGDPVDQRTFVSDSVNTLFSEVHYGNHHFPTAGASKLRFTVVGQNPAATDDEVGIDYLLLVRVPPTPVSVSLGNLVQTYDGLPKAVSVSTNPAGVPVTVTYDGSTTPPTAAGVYAVAAEVVDPMATGSAAAFLAIEKAPAMVALDDAAGLDGTIARRYDGTPQALAVSTQPPGLPTLVTYNGSSDAPTLPGTYLVDVSILDPNHAGSTTAVLRIATTVLVRHGPAFTGGIDGSVQVLLPENTTLNGHAWISGNLLVPGTPGLLTNGHPVYAGIIDAGGDPAPDTYQVILNGQPALGYLVRQVDPIAMPVVEAPPSPTGTRSVYLSRPDQTVGDFASVLNLTIAGNAGLVSVPPGTYGSFAATGKGTLVLGTPGSLAPSVYNLQVLSINALPGSARLQVVGPVLLTVAKSVVMNGLVGSSEHPEWLDLRVSSGRVTTSGASKIYGSITVPDDVVTLNGAASVIGSIIADRLVLNGTSEVSEPTP